MKYSGGKNLKPVKKNSLFKENLSLYCLLTVLDGYKYHHHHQNITNQTVPTSIKSEYQEYFKQTFQSFAIANNLFVYIQIYFWAASFSDLPTCKRGFVCYAYC